MGTGCAQVARASEKAIPNRILFAALHPVVRTATIKGGYLYGNDQPGLGIDIKEEIARKYPMKDNPSSADWTTVRRLDGSLVKP